MSLRFWAACLDVIQSAAFADAPSPCLFGSAAGIGHPTEPRVRSAPGQRILKSPIRGPRGGVTSICP
jgi:hypothetical protein